MLTAGNDRVPQAEAALETLCRTYWGPIYAYIRQRGYPEADAQDLTQEFFAWVLKRNWLGVADPQRGRFRCFLQVSLNRFLANAWDKSQAQKRGGGRVLFLSSAEFENRCDWEPVDHLTPEQYYEWQWAMTLLDRAIARLGDEYAAMGKARLFEELKPCLLGERTEQPYATLALKLGLTEGSVKVAAYRLRQRYRELLREEIANTLANPDEAEDELRHLFEVLARK